MMRMKLILGTAALVVASGIAALLYTQREMGRVVDDIFEDGTWYLYVAA